MLHTHGYQIHKQVFSQREVEETVPLVEKNLYTHKESIFNHNTQAMTDDVKRFQSRLRPRSNIERSLSLPRRIHEFVAHHHPTLRANDIFILESLPGCQQQMPHTDYIPTPELLAVSDKHMPLGCLVALQSPTFLYVWPKSIRQRYTMDKRVKVELSAGDVLVFRGDLVHAGADYDERNVRIHAYLDSQHVKRVKNKTQLIIGDL